MISIYKRLALMLVFILLSSGVVYYSHYEKSQNHKKLTECYNQAAEKQNYVYLAIRDKFAEQGEEMITQKTDEATALLQATPEYKQIQEQISDLKSYTPSIFIVFGSSIIVLLLSCILIDPELYIMSGFNYLSDGLNKEKVALFVVPILFVVNSVVLGLGALTYYYSIFIK